MCRSKFFSGIIIVGLIISLNISCNASLLVMNTLACMLCTSFQSSLTLCDPMDYSLPGSSVHGILQARILEWVAMASSRGSSWPGVESVSPMSPALQVDSLPLSHQGKPWILLFLTKKTFFSLHFEAYFHQLYNSGITVLSVNLLKCLSLSSRL